jgi:mRNA interferase YafQ
MLKIKFTSRMKRDLKLLKKQKKDLSKLQKVLNMLADEIQLPPEYRDHSLGGRLSAFRECHIEGDWLLVYQIQNDRLILSVIASGSHSEALHKYLT